MTLRSPFPPPLLRLVAHLRKPGLLVSPGIMSRGFLFQRSANFRIRMKPNSEYSEAWDRCQGYVRGRLSAIQPHLAATVVRLKSATLAISAGLVSHYGDPAPLYWCTINPTLATADRDNLYRKPGSFEWSPTWPCGLHFAASTLGGATGKW